MLPSRNVLNPYLQMYKFYNDINRSPHSCLTNTWRLQPWLKATIVLLIICVTQVGAAKAQTVTLTEKNSRLSTVLEKIRKQTGYDFLYTTSMLKGASPVNISLKNAPLERALTSIFSNQPLQFSIKDKSVVISKRATLTYTVVHPTLHGVIYDENNKALPGASVRIDGLEQPAVSDHIGVFFLKDPPSNGNLIVSYLGFETDTLAIAGRQEINVHLKMANFNMKEVVIVNTGYQKLNKERATGSFGKPDMKIFNDRAGTTDIVGRMEGLVAGMTVKPTFMVQNSRYGTGQSQESIIRGQSTVQLGYNPIYVVNGVQVENLSMLNTDDVADISVLKDASAAAIWGARAANGVIVVTTKGGRAGEKVKFNYSGYITIQNKPDFSYGRYMNSSQLIQASREIFDPVAIPWNTLSNAALAPHELILYNQNRGLLSASQADSKLDSLASIDNRQQIKDIWYRNSFTTNQTISASGGSQFYNFYSSLSYLKNHSNQPRASDNTYRMTLNQTINPTKSIRLSLHTIISNNITYGVSPASVSLDFVPYQLFRDAAGNPLNMNFVQGLSDVTRLDYQARSRINLDYNPLNDLNSTSMKTNQLTINTTADLGVKIIKGLTFNGTYGYQKSPGTTAKYDDASLYSMRRDLLNYTVARSTASLPIYYLPTTGGKYTRGLNDNYSWTVRNQLMYSTRFRNDKDELNLQAGQEMQEQYRSTETTIARGYDQVLKTTTLIDYNTLAQGIFGTVGSFRSVLNELPYRQIFERTRYRSYFGLMSYSFDSKYVLDASIRRDYSNLFASGSSSQKKPAYSFGGKWLASKEEFMKSQTWIDNLGLRVTYGITGNSPYLTAGSMVDILTTEIDNTYGNSLYITAAKNDKLNWESTHTFNTGVDFGILKGRLSGSIDYYKKNTTDLIGVVPVNPLSGSNNTTGNIGNVTNEGFEFSLRSINLQTSSFSWNTNLVFSYNQNKLESYSVIDPSQFTASNRLNAVNVVGFSSPSLFAYRYAGLDNMGDPQIKLADGTITKAYDAAGADDLVYMGTTQPKFNGGLSNTVRYKNISLTANMIFNLGAVMRRDVNDFYTGLLFRDGTGFVGNLNEDFNLRWKTPGDESFTNIPSYVASRGISGSRRNTMYYTYADINVVSASYVKLRDITLSYDFTARVLNAIHLDAARLYVQSGNFMIWKANQYNIDPEFQSFTTGKRIIPAFTHPITFGATVTF